MMQTLQLDLIKIKRNIFIEVVMKAAPVIEMMIMNDIEINVLKILERNEIFIFN